MSTLIPDGSRVALRGIEWRTYESLRQAAFNRNIRMTFDRGVLEIASPSKPHERIVKLLGRLIEAWTEERDIAVQSCGSMTFKREDLQRGLEPDECYYLAHEPDVREREELDLTIDPPPDLVVEVDLTASSAHRLPLYAALGVPEVWQWRTDNLQVLTLSDGGYAVQPESLALPEFPLAEAAQIILMRAQSGETALLKAFRKLVRKN